MFLSYLIVKGLLLPLAEVREWLPLAPARVCMSSEEQAIPLVPRPWEGSNYIQNALRGRIYGFVSEGFRFRAGKLASEPSLPPCLAG